MQDGDKVFKAFKAFDRALTWFREYPADPTFDSYPDAKGYLINKGYSANFAEFLIKKLLEEGIEEDRIKVYYWGTEDMLFHVVVVVDDTLVLDASKTFGLVELTRNNINLLFLEMAARHALDFGEYCYIVSNNKNAIIYDPWGFVDNQDFDHEAMSTLAVYESVLGVKEFLERRNNENSKESV